MFFLCCSKSSVSGGAYNIATGQFVLHLVFYMVLSRHFTLVFYVVVVVVVVVGGGGGGIGTHMSAEDYRM